jgi:hypothetical protein
MQKIIWIALLFLAAGCQERTRCPAFSEDYRKWMPYEIGQKCWFTDGTDTILLVVSEIYRSDEYLLKQPVLFGKMPCNAEATVRMAGSQAGPEIEILSDYFSDTSPLDGNINYSFVYDDESSFMVYFADESVLNNPWNQTTLMASFNNGFKTYNKVIRMTIDTVSVSNRINQMYVASSVGIIQFRDWKSRKTWRLL